MTTLIPAWINGTLTPMDKLEVHRRGLRHKAVSVFVLSGDHVLIQQRALSKYHTPGLWANTCCTHPHWDEAPITCAHRRLHEELGLSNLTLTQAGQVEYRASVPPDMIEHELVEIFTAQAPLTLHITPNPAEVLTTAWVPLAKLLHDTQTTPEIFTPWLRIYLHDHPHILQTAIATQP
ncbi:MAG: isopentenyl-diphosphate delta-isomerase [Pseudomonadota bacterium]